MRFPRLNPFAWRRLAARLRLLAPTGSRRLFRLSLGVASAVPLALTWYNSFWLRYAVALYILLLATVLWRQWAGLARLGSWFVGSVVLTGYWSSTFLMWLFFESTWSRSLLLILTTFFTWWYLREWHRLRQTLFLGEAGAGGTPTLVLGFLSCFAFGSAAESFLVFLDMSIWWLLVYFYLPIAALVLCLVYASGWSLVKRWPYWFTGCALLLQVFLLVTWWPTSFYVVGFSLAAAFALIALVVRQEAQGFISRRSFSRELSLVGAVLVLVLITARWF